jgi:hypothetical protein
VGHVPPRDAAQFLVYEWNQLFECRLVAIAPVDEQPCDLMRYAP